MPVPNYGHITDIRAIVNFHRFAPYSRLRRDSRPRLSSRGNSALEQQIFNYGGPVANEDRI